MTIPTLQELLEAGVHFGHQVRRGHPRMKPYIYGAREGVHIIDLTKSQQMLKEACAYATELGKSGGQLLILGTKKQSKDIVAEVAKKVGAFYLTERWIGGFMTNFDEISKNIKKMKELKEAKEKGQLSMYTKKEQLLISRKVEKLERDLAGAAEITSVPEAIFIIDTVRENTAVLECNRAGVKIIAISDSNSNPSLVDYPIPGNDDAIKSIKVITEAIGAAYEEGKKQAPKKEESVSQGVKESKVEEKKADKKAEVVTDELPAEVAAEVAAAEEEVEKAVVAESERKE